MASISPPTVDDTLGAVMIGFSVACVIFGVLTTQTISYFSFYPSDQPAYKVLVAVIWLLEGIDQGFLGYSVYYYTISNFLTPAVLISGGVVWPLILQTVFGALVGTIVKICFAMRVWRFSDHNIPIVGTILILILAQFCLSMTYAARAFELNSLVYVSQLKLLATLSLASGLVTDILTAAALCFYLRRLRTGWKKPDSLINSLTVYAINTGALTSTISLATLLFYNIRPSAFYFMASYFVLSKLYAISFLCALNTRKVVRGRGTDHGGINGGGTNPTELNVFGSTFSLVNPSRATRIRDPEAIRSLGQTTTKVEIEVARETSVTSDFDREAGVKLYHGGGYR